MKIMSLLIAALLFAATAQAAEVAGVVGYMSGALAAQRADGTVKSLGSKSDVLVGDLLITAKDSYAQIQMRDGAKMTLRPNSRFRIEAYAFKQDDPESDNAVFRLLKGGFRTVTGLIGKRGNRDAYKVHAASATIGIRGTEFASRLCANQNCLDDASDKPATKTAVRQSQVIGRVVLLQGELSAQDGAGNTRTLSMGGPVFQGDRLSTANRSVAVVAFRDESRISLQENTVFLVDRFRYDKATSQENAVLRLIKGGVRVFTGLIGKINHEDYQFHVANATIGIRGTGFDSWCHGPCASGADHPGASEAHPLDGAGVFVWSGEVALIADCANCPAQIVSVGQAAIIARDTGKPVQIRLVPQGLLDNDAPRPDGIRLDMDKLFGARSADGEPGLYVTVQEGHVILVMGDKTLDLGRSETGFAGAGQLVRLASPPAFMGTDLQINANNPGANPGGCVVQ